MIRFALLALLIAAPTTASHAETKVGPEFIISPAARFTSTPRVATLNNGNFAVTWESQAGVYVRLFGANRLPLTSPKLAGRTGWRPEIAALAGGGYVVVFTAHVSGKLQNNHIHGRIYDQSGNPIGPEFRINDSQHTMSQTDPSVAALSGGGFVAAWYAGEDRIVVGRQFTATGIPITPDFFISEDPDDLGSNVVLAPFGNNGFVAAWSSGGVFARLFPGAGPPSSEFQVSTNTSGAPTSLASLADGGFVIVWSSGEDGSGSGVYARRYDSSGVADGGQFRANTTIQSDQYDGAAAGLTDGGFIITWTSLNQDGSSLGIYAQRYDADGDPVGGEFKVNSVTTGPQSHPAVSALRVGKFVIVWDTRRDEARSEIHGQRFGP